LIFPIQSFISWKDGVDRLTELGILVAVLETGSLTAAARRLRLSAPAVTRGLAALEARTGVRLVERSTRRLAPTESGARMADRARMVLAAYGETVREPEDAALRGRLRITAPVVFGSRHVGPLVMQFLALHRQVQIELELADRNLDLIEEALDLAVRIGHMADSSLVARRVGEVRRVLVASPAYVAANGMPQMPGELIATDAIVTSLHSTPMQWRFPDGKRERVINLAPRLLINDVEAVLDAARAGHGVVRALSYQVVNDIAEGRLVRLLEAFEPPPLPVQLVVSGTRYMPARLRLFLDYAAGELGKLAVIHERAIQPG